MDKFDRYNLPEEIDKQTDLVRKYGYEMAKAKAEYSKAEKLYELTKSSQKKDLEVLYGKIYTEQKSKISDGKLKHIVCSDSRYISLIESQKKQLKVLINRVSDAEELKEKYTTDYFAACQRKSLIESAIKLLIGGFYDVNEKKVKDEYNKEKRLKTNKLKTED